MSNFIVTFRIKNDDGYQDRYNSFMEKARELADVYPWTETTSFIAFCSKSATSTAESICSALYVGSQFDSTKDLMVVIDLNNRAKAIKGPLQYPALLEAGLGF